MASIPRGTLDESYTLGITCAICGADSLKVNHVSNLPDYVTCNECASAFLVEEAGDRIFYGQIAAGFTETERFALKQWAWLEAVETRAREERTATSTLTPDTPQGQIATVAEPIQEPEDVEPAIQSESGEDWISSEIPREQLQQELDAVDLADAVEVEAQLEMDEPLISQAEIPARADEKPFSFRPFDIDDTDTTSEPVIEDAEDQGLAEFFEALTDETGEVAPIAEPDEFLSGEDSPAKSELDAELDRLLQTEDDAGPELAPPPWAAKSEPEVKSFAEEASRENLPTWGEHSELEPMAEGDAIPVVDPKEETYESLPSFKNLEDSTPMSQADDIAGTREWGVPAEATSDEDLPSWADFEEEDSMSMDETAPETPAWALPQDDEPFGTISEAGGAEPQAWDADSVEEPTTDFQWAPPGYPKEGSVEDDFLSGLRRSASVPLESQPVVDHPISDFEDLEADVPWDQTSDDLSARMQAISQAVEQPERVAAGWEMTASTAASLAAPKPEPEYVEPILPFEDEIYVAPASDPPQGQRYRVVIRGERVVFPGGDCAHCGRTPVKGKLAVAGTLPRGQTVGQRRPTRFEVPLCADCRKRAASKSEEARAAQLQAHLISGIVGMGLVVGALALGLINPRDLGIADLFLGLIFFIVGYGGPAFFLLNRVGNFLPPVDSRYVRTTLLVPGETQGLETAFEWRNNEYAHRFDEANQANTLGNVTSIKDRMG
jgi:hypothetical protein